MIRKFASVISALIFMFGALVLVVGFVLAWLLVIAAAAQQTHWTVGAVLFVASLWAGQRYEAWLRTPWELWRALWAYVDDELEHRMKGS